MPTDHVTDEQPSASDVVYEVLSNGIVCASYQQRMTKEQAENLIENHTRTKHRGFLTVRKVSFKQRQQEETFNYAEVDYEDD